MGRLAHIGQTTGLRRKLFPDGFGAEVMQLILDTWLVFTRHHSLRLEEKITAVFRNALIDAYVAAGRSWFITLEDPVVDPTYGTELGRNDMNFFPPKHHGQKVFFTLECKRLHVWREPTKHAVAQAEKAGKIAKPTFEHLADAYVTDGMQRFVDGQYSQGLPCGGMVGYVLDNELETAIGRVCENITARVERLSIVSKTPITPPSKVLPGWLPSLDTVHTRTDGDVVLHHLLVGIGV